MTKLNVSSFLVLCLFISACGESYTSTFFEDSESEIFYSEYDFSSVKSSGDNFFDRVYFAVDMMKVDHLNYQIRLDFFSDENMIDYEFELIEVDFLFPQKKITVAGEVASFSEYLENRKLYKGQIKLFVISESRVREFLRDEGGFNVVVKLRRGSDEKILSFYLRKIVRSYQSFST